MIKTNTTCISKLIIDRTGYTITGGITSTDNVTLDDAIDGIRFLSVIDNPLSGLIDTFDYATDNRLLIYWLIRDRLNELSGLRFGHNSINGDVCGFWND